jgi:hypothetical protein
VVADVLAALESREHVPAHDGEDLVVRSLRAPVLVRYADGSVEMGDAISLDALPAAGAGAGVDSAVASIIPVWRDAA